MLSVIRNDGTMVLTRETVMKLVTFEKAVKEIKEAEEKLKADLLKEMENAGVIKIDDPEVLITYIAETDRETFDSKAFRADHPDLYDDYVKMTTVKPSIRIKVR